MQQTIDQEPCGVHLHAYGDALHGNKSGPPAVLVQFLVLFSFDAVRGMLE